MRLVVVSNCCFNGCRVLKVSWLRSEKRIVTTLVRTALERWKPPRPVKKRFASTLADLKKRIAAAQPRLEEIQRVLREALAPLRLADVRVEPRHHQVAEAVRTRGLVLPVLQEMRVIVPTARACYSALGALHMARRAVPNSIRDYISNPKPNRYQALETALFE